jgi:ABC-type transporter Mla subunit MlaD
MAEPDLTLIMRKLDEVLAGQRAARDDWQSMRDDLNVLTAMVLRLDNEMKRQTDRLDRFAADINHRFAKLETA